MKTRLVFVLVLATTVATAMAAVVGPAPARAGSDFPVEIELVVKLAPTASPVDVAASVGMTAGDPLIGSRNVHVVTSVQFVDDPTEPKKLAEAAKHAVKDAEKDDRVLWAIERTPATAHDQRFHAWPSSEHGAASAEDVVEQPAFESLELDAVHDVVTGDGAVVAVLDTGVDADHPFFDGRVLPGYDLVDDDDDPSDVADGVDSDGDGRVDGAHGHGTFVAGIVLQIAPDAWVLPVRVLDDEGRGDMYAIVEGIAYATDRGADVINLSFGLESGDQMPKLLEEAVKAARKAGVIVVGAAGNDGQETKTFPASVSGVISVTALGGDHAEVADFATRGKWVTVAAPGHDIVSSIAGGGFARWTGTSMAAPVVSGGYALLVEGHPDEKSKKIEDVLLKHARKMLRKGMADKGSLDLLSAVV